MIFRIVCVCLTLAVCYALYGIWSVQSRERFLTEPMAQFTVLNDGNQTNLTIVEFLNYGCTYCRATHRVLVDYAKKNPTVKLVVRPVPFSPDAAETAAERVLAAGLQGKFWEMDAAMTEYMGDYDEKFYKETASLYEIDYDRMILDANGGAVFKLAKNNASAAIRADVKSTPALMVNKKLYELKDPLTLPDLLRMVQAETTKPY